ncbi:glycosyltransferase family 4 protein [Empedobacter sp. ULE_I136]
MKITLLFLGRNGAGPKYAFNMAKELALKKDSITLQIVIPSHIDNLSDWDFLANNFENVLICKVKTYSNKKEFVKKITNPFTFVKIVKDIKKFQPDWIYMPMGSLLNFGILPLLKCYKKVYTLHDPILHKGEQSFFIEKLRQIEINSSDKIILLNNYFIDYVIANYKINKSDIFVIPHAGFFSKNQPQKIESFHNKILFLGRIEQYKGIDLLLDSFEEIIKEKANIQLTIAGKGDLKPYVEKINSFGEKIIVENNWLTDDDIENLLMNHDFVILPYTDASQSGVIPLAFGNGKIAIATNVGALSEQVPTGIGFCIEPDPSEISKKVIQIYNLSVDELANMNSKAYKYACNNLTWKSSIEKLLQILMN